MLDFFSISLNLNWTAVSERQASGRMNNMFKNCQHWKRKSSCLSEIGLTRMCMVYTTKWQHLCGYIEEIHGFRRLSVHHDNIWQTGGLHKSVLAVDLALKTPYSADVLGWYLFCSKMVVICGIPKTLSNEIISSRNSACVPKMVDIKSENKGLVTHCSAMISCIQPATITYLPSIHCSHALHKRGEIWLAN